jgi:hypothetical protein
MAIRFTGKKPSTYINDKLKDLVNLLNNTAADIERELIQDSPANFGRLKGAWKLIPTSERNKRAIVGNSVKYLLPVELGRAPGKGISQEGQVEVKRWGKLVLGLSSDREQSSFAYLLSEKYKREGRPAIGFIGLAKPGTIPSKPGQNAPDTPVKGSLLWNAFKQLEQDLNKI